MRGKGKLISGSQPFSPDSTSFIANSNSNSSPNQPNTTRNFTQMMSFEPRRATISCKYCKKPGHTVESVTNYMGSLKISSSPREKGLLHVSRLSQQNKLHLSLIHLKMKTFHMGFLRNNMLILCLYSIRCRCLLQISSLYPKTLHSMQTLQVGMTILLVCYMVILYVMLAITILALVS